MKRIAMVCMLLLMVVAVNAQRRGYVCTGDNVNIRKGPGKNYAVKSDYGYGKLQLFKGTVVVSLGKKQNGFCYIRKYGWQGDWDATGWVSAQYLRPVTICSRCDGWGQMSDGTGGIIDCTKCYGRGYTK